MSYDEKELDNKPEGQPVNIGTDRFEQQSGIILGDNHADMDIEKKEPNFILKNQAEDSTQQTASYRLWEEKTHNSAQENSIAADKQQKTQDYKSTEGYEAGQIKNCDDRISTVEYHGSMNHIPQEPDKKRKKFGLAKKALLLAAAAAVFGLVAGACFQGMNLIAGRLNANTDASIEASNNQEKTETPISTTTVVQSVSTDNDVTEVVENTMPSIVSITSIITSTYHDFWGDSYDKDAQGSGSGIIVGKNNEELLIVTNNHVIDNAKKLKVTFIDNKVLNAEVKGKDSTADLAVIAVKLTDISKETLNAIKVASLGNSDDVRVGQKAVAIGNALGYGQSVTVGYISAKNREVTVDNNTMTLLQTDAAINPGNSGGALLNINGQVIGINSVKYASSEVEGMGYAIPISKAMPIINDLMNKKKIKEGEEGYLGITGRTVPAEITQMYNMPSGVYVNETVKKGPAAKAGIITGDIITAVNGMGVDTIQALVEKVNSYAAGTKVTVALQRAKGGSYEEKKIEVTLGKMSKEMLEKQKETETENQVPDFGYNFEP